MNRIIKSLNLNEGAVLTLEKLEDRMEFEAILIMAGQGDANKGGNPDPCLINIVCTVCLDEQCHPRYINCHPYK